MSAAEAYRPEHLQTLQHESTVVDTINPQAARRMFFQLVQGSENMPLLQSVANLIEANLTHPRRVGAKEGEVISDFVHGYHVGILLTENGVKNPLILAAALGHDVFEDTEITPAKMQEVLAAKHGSVTAGGVVAAIWLLSKEVKGEEGRSNLPLAEYYRLLSAQSSDIRAIKVADRMTKILGLIRMGLDRQFKENKTVKQKLAEILEETDVFYPALVKGTELEAAFGEVVAKGKQALHSFGN